MSYKPQGIGGKLQLFACFVVISETWCWLNRCDSHFWWLTVLGNAAKTNWTLLYTQMNSAWFEWTFNELWEVDHFAPRRLGLFNIQEFVVNLNKMQYSHVTLTFRSLVDLSGSFQTHDMRYCSFLTSYAVRHALITQLLLPVEVKEINDCTCCHVARRSSWVFTASRTKSFRNS